MSLGSHNQLKSGQSLSDLAQLLHSHGTKIIHFIGILGSGMRPLSELLAQLPFMFGDTRFGQILIQGSDLRAGPNDKSHTGHRVFASHSADHLKTASGVVDAVIYTGVITENHPEFKGAR
ncbi:MAG: hypothetical protein OXC40_07275, partial [Proteobacteria bacterium]|nr:hypothetical protein [Pseudomonadota bacterium]